MTSYGSAKVAVVGSGYWGKNLVRNFHTLGALGLVCDKNEILLNKFQQEYPGVGTSLSLSDALRRDDIQAVAIATPAETHFAIAREALLAGKHAYVEKPLVLDEDQGRELIELARERGLVLMVGHLLQYHPAFITLKRMAAAGELGRINYIYSHRLNLGKIRREENILWSFAPHDLSMILSLAGEMPESVQTTGGYYLHSKIADVTTTHLEFSTGLKAHIFVSWLHPFKEQKLVVVGDKQMVVFDDTNPWDEKLLAYPHQIKWENGAPVPAKGEATRIPVEQSEPLRQECLHFIECISEGRTPVTDGREGLDVLRVLNASQRSLDENGRKIAVGPTTNGRHAVGAESSPAFVHETVVIDPKVEIGPGTKIWHFSHVLSGSRIGSGCNLGQNVVVGPDAVVGNGCKIQNNVSIYKGVTLEDDVFCGPSMVFTNIFNPRAHIPRMAEVRGTLVRKGATLGANCTIICGVTIGRHAFVGAGAVVTRDVPDHALVMGNPARQNGWMCICGLKLGPDLRCTTCDRSFERTSQGLRETTTSNPLLIEE